MQQQYKLGELLKARYVNNDGCLGLVCANYTRVQVRKLTTSIAGINCIITLSFKSSSFNRKSTHMVSLYLNMNIFPNLPRLLQERENQR